MAAIFLCRRKQSNNNVYEVTLVDPGVDYSTLDDLSAVRSWMIGLSAHGLQAVKQIPGLYEDYIEGLGVTIKRATVVIGSRLKFHPDLHGEGLETFFTVDRNFICAALSKYLNDNCELVAKYNTRALYVDVDNKEIIVRDTTSLNKNSYAIEYDYVIGADGIRSVVRNAFMNCHRDFEFDLKGTFSISKSAHIPIPDDMKEGTYMFLFGTLHGGTIFGLPETGRMSNWNIGIPMNKSLAPELYSDDVKVVEKYFRDTLKIIDGWDFALLAKEWVSQKFNTTQQTHCNFYHSNVVHGIIMGDAAHACLPVLGQGMNTALADAAALNELLDKYNDDWEEVLPAFSEERVKEGNAVTDLSFYNLSCSDWQNITLKLGEMCRRIMNKIFPSWLVMTDPRFAIAKGMKLSKAYNDMMKMDAIEPVRRVNDKIMRDYFEKRVGMVTTTTKWSFWSCFTWTILPVGALAIGVYFMVL